MACARSTSGFRASLFFAALLVACAFATGNAAPPQGSGGTATIKFRALAGDDTPVRDLKPGDLTLKIDGKPRELLSVDLVDLRSPEGAAAKPAVDPPFMTNVAQADGRDVYILVDEESIPPGRDAAVKEAANHLLSAIAPGDRAALISMRQGGPNLGLTRNHEAVRKAVGSLAGYGNPSESSTDLTCRTVKTVQALQSVFDAAKGSTPPAVVLFSASVAALQAGRTATMRAGGSDGGSSDLCQLRPEEFRRLGDAAQNASAMFFAVELLEASSTTPPAEAVGGLENLAGTTNGELVRMGGNVDAQMSRIAQATSSYYVATFASDPADRSGGGKRVDLASTRSGVSLKAPREIALGAPAGRKSVSPRDMIRVADPFTALPLRAAAYASRNPGDKKVRVLALFQPIEGDTKLKAATIAMYDKGGDNKAQWNAQSSELGGPMVIAALTVEPGEYRMRVAATDSNGRAGAVDIPFSAMLIEAGPIQLGDLVLGKMGQGNPIPVLQFESEQEAMAIVELYGRPAGPLKMYAEILNPSGDPIQVPLSPAATNEQDKFLLSATLPIGSLQPGDYAVRAIVGVEGAPEAVVTTTLRKVKAGS